MPRVKRALGALVVSAVVAGGLSVVSSPAAHAAEGPSAPPAAVDRGLLDLPLPAPDQYPQLSGVPLVGELLSVSQPVWNALPGDLISTDITWLCNGSPIPGTEGLWQYVPTELQAGCLITAQVTTTVLGFLPLEMITNALQIPGIGETETPISATAAPTVKADKGSPKVGSTLSTTDPEWNQDGVTTAFQWLRNGQPIAGQTGRTYTVTPADVDKAIAVRATGSKSDATPGVVTSNALTAVLGDAPTPTTQPKITGTPAVGSTLTVDPGAWGTGETPVYAYQWRRDDKMLDGAVSSTYQVTTEDVGHVLTATVTATRQGYRPGTFRTAGVTVSKLASTLSASMAKKVLKKGKPAVMRLVLSVPGLAGPTGEVTVSEAGRTVRTASFVAAKQGRLTIKLGKLKPGVHKFRAVYAGSDVAEGSSSKVVKVKVKKAKKKR